VSYLLDTNVVSELTKPKPEDKVVEWFKDHTEEMLFLCVITLGELRRGVLTLPLGKKRSALEGWIQDDVKSRFRGRILPVDAEVMEHWAQLQFDSQKQGISVPILDSLIAATALTHDLVLVTRNEADFKNTRVRLFNPWF
jgi:toxin FitB